MESLLSGWLVLSSPTVSIPCLTNSESPWGPSSPSNWFEAASAQCCCSFSCYRDGWCCQYESLWLLQETWLGLESIHVSNIFQSSLFPCQEKDLRNLLYNLSIQHQHLPLSFSFIGHMGRSAPHKINVTISVPLLNQHFTVAKPFFLKKHFSSMATWQFYSCPKIYKIATIKFMKVIVSILPHSPSQLAQGLLLPHNGCLPGLSPQSFPVNRHPPPNLSAPNWALKKKTYPPTKPEIYWKIPWKIHQVDFISWDESAPKSSQSSSIQVTRQGFLQVEFTQRWSTPFLKYNKHSMGKLGNYPKKKVTKSSPWQVQSIFQEDSFHWKCDPFRFQSQQIEGCTESGFGTWFNYLLYMLLNTKLPNTPIFVAELPPHFQRSVNLNRRTSFKPHFTSKKTYLAKVYLQPTQGCPIEISIAWLQRLGGEPVALRPLVIHSVHGAIPLELLNASVSCRSRTWQLEVDHSFLGFCICFQSWLSQNEKNMSKTYVGWNWILKYFFSKDVLNLASFWAKNLTWHLCFRTINVLEPEAFAKSLAMTLSPSI